jgi:hypothetical protein
MATVIDGSAGVTTNAGGSVNPSTNVEGINYSCRAWVNFNGTGTVAIRGSGNVTSITDNGTGLYTLNFTTALTDTNYGISSFVRKDNSNADAAICAVAFDNSTKTTSALQIVCYIEMQEVKGLLIPLK